ncbi:MAG: cell division protein ZapA [Pseudomonadota bacterium]
MSDSKTVTVKILDVDYQVNCSAEEVAALQRSANFLDQKMREIKDQSNVFGLDRLAVMAALNLTNDLLSEADKSSRLNNEQNVIVGKLDAQQSEIESLSNKVDSALTRIKSRLN